MPELFIECSGSPNLLRSDSQQAAWLVDHQQAKAFKTIPRPAIQIDRRKNGILVGETFLSASDLAGYLSQLTAK